MEEYEQGSIIEGKVTGVEDYGIFLSFGNNCNGLIHISEISSAFVKNPKEYAKINDIIKAKIISKEENNHYKLSIKQLSSESDLQKKDKNGFKTLSEMLDTWIKESKIKIDKKAKKE